MNDWNPKLYLKFEQERTLPARNLLENIIDNNPKRILDLGCGPGNSTKLLKDKWPNSHIVGLDSSPNMIEKARNNLPGIEWVTADAGGDLTSLGKFDLIFSNAVFQWIPKHETLIGQLFKILNKNGIIAAQIPYVLDMPIKKATDQVAMSNKWSKYITDKWEFFMHKAEFYFDILSSYTNDTCLWETTFYHIMNNHRDIIDWYKSTGMRPYLDVLPDEKSVDEFLNDVLSIIENEYSIQKNGKVLFPFTRVFFIAYKK